MESILQSQVLTIASTVGAVAFALSGFLAGVRRNLDVMGLFILALLTANGGGVIRDLLIDKPPAVLASMMPFWIAGGICLTAWFTRLHKRPSIDRRWIFVICDAAGLVAFGISGALIGLEEGAHFFGVLTLSFLTATGGGILRDLLINAVPEVLHSGFYGSVAIILACMLFILDHFAMINAISILLCFIGLVFLRLIAYKQEWRLPKL